jgi:hypothetical protein
MQVISKGMREDEEFAVAALLGASLFYFWILKKIFTI